MPAKVIASLPESQAGEGRHRCPGCAYEAGYAAGVKQGEWNMRQRVEELMQKVKGWAKDTGVGRGR